MIHRARPSQRFSSFTLAVRQLGKSADLKLNAHIYARLNVAQEFLKPAISGLYVKKTKQKKRSPQRQNLTTAKSIAALK